MDQIGDTRGPASTEQIKDLPKKVESVSSILTSGNISLTWQASEDADYYNVYRLKGASLEKLAEVKSPEYTLKGELWKSYTFRVSAVNREGNESELSDPVGIVVTPWDELVEVEDAIDEIRGHEVMPSLPNVPLAQTLSNLSTLS